MEIVKTKSFELATISRGDKNAARLALLLPGRLDTKDYLSFVSHAEYLAARGFFAVAFDPPGTWDSPGGVELFTTTNYIKAVNELIEYFGNKPTLLVGHSRGGAVAVIAGTSNPAVVAIVGLMAAYGEPSVPEPEATRLGYHLSHRDLPPGTSKTSEQKEFRLPIAYWEDGKQYNAAETIKKCAKPKLMIYATDDEFMTPNEVRAVYASAPEPKMIKEVSCGHDYRYSPGVLNEINEEIGVFIKKYLHDSPVKQF